MKSKPAHLLLHAPRDREVLLRLTEEHAGSAPRTEHEILQLQPQLVKEKMPTGLRHKTQHQQTLPQPCGTQDT